MNDIRTVQVHEYLDLVNNTLRMIPSTEFFIEGEVSDYRVAQQKWVSFDLKDEKEQAVLKCFATIWQLQTPLEDGMKVRVQGYSKIYERFGTFKLNIQKVELVGEGALRRAYELLKKKMEQEGLFDSSHKRALPRFPKRIGLITSRDAAAYGDFLRILNNRWGGVEVMHSHVQVQGKEAVPTILQAYAYFNQLPEDERPDVLVMTRGGGGLEDLHAFNDEQVARAVFQSTIPVVCGVGHERDESLCDFVADVRASTPSNAAERVVPNRNDILYELSNMTQYMESKITDKSVEIQRVIDDAMRAIGYLIDREQERLTNMRSELVYKMNTWLPRLKGVLDSHMRVLGQLDPKKVLSRGYSIVSVQGSVLKNAKTLEIGREIRIQLANDSLDAEILRINGKGKQKLV